MKRRLRFLVTSVMAPTFAQGRDPSLHEMLLKMSAVQRRLIKKSEALVAKDVQLRELERINGELKKQLIQRPGPDVGQRLNQSRYAVKAKSRQIKASRRSKFYPTVWFHGILACRR